MNFVPFFCVLWVVVVCAQNSSVPTKTFSLVGNYGEVLIQNHFIDSTTFTHMMNFTFFSIWDFIHVEFHLSCDSTNSLDWRNEVWVSRNRGRFMETYPKYLYERKAFTEDSATSYWITDFDIQDCFDVNLCIFAVSIMTYSACQGSIEVERGDSVPYGAVHHFTIPQNSSRYTTKRLVQYHPVSVPQKIRVIAEGTWFIFYHWGYTNDVHVGSSIDDLVVALHEDENYADGDRLMMWFDGAPGDYEFHFLNSEWEMEVQESMLPRIIIVSLSFFFTFVFIFTSVYVCISTHIRTWVRFNSSGLPYIVRGFDEPSLWRQATEAELQMTTKTLSYHEASNLRGSKKGSHRTRSKSKSPVKLWMKECVICMEQFDCNSELRVLPCGHCFHLACVDPWLLHVRKDCPICHQSVLTAQNFYKSSTRSTTPSEKNSMMQLVCKKNQALGPTSSVSQSRTETDTNHFEITIESSEGTETFRVTRSEEVPSSRHRHRTPGLPKSLPHTKHKQSHSCDFKNSSACNEESPAHYTVKIVKIPTASDSGRFRHKRSISKNTRAHSAASIRCNQPIFQRGGTSGGNSTSRILIRSVSTSREHTPSTDIYIQPYLLQSSRPSLASDIPVKSHVDLSLSSSLPAFELFE